MVEKSFASCLHEELAGLLPGGRSWTRPLAMHALVWGVFGVLIPVRKGLDFFDPLILGAYASLGAVFAIPAIVRDIPDFSGNRVLSRVLASVAYGEAMALGILALGIGTVYWTHRNGVLFPPEWGGLAAMALFGACLSAALGMAAAWLVIQFSPSAARFLLRAAMLGLLLLFLYRGRFLPDVAWTGASWAAGIALIFAWMIHKPGSR